MTKPQPLGAIISPNGIIETPAPFKGLTMGGVNGEARVRKLMEAETVLLPGDTIRDGKLERRE